MRIVTPSNEGTRNVQQKSCCPVFRYFPFPLGCHGCGCFLRHQFLVAHPSLGRNAGDKVEDGRGDGSNPTRADRYGGRGDRELLGLIFCCGLSVTPSPLCRKDREGSETIRSTSDEQRNFPPTVSRCAHTVSKAAAGAA